jgi:hypothetical protein
MSECSEGEYVESDEDKTRAANSEKKKSVYRQSYFLRSLSEE